MIEVQLPPKVLCPNCLKETLGWADMLHSAVQCDTCHTYTKVATPTLNEVLNEIKGLTPVEHIEATHNRHERRKIEVIKKKPGRPKKVGK